MQSLRLAICASDPARVTTLTSLIVTLQGLILDRYVLEEESFLTWYGQTGTGPDFGLVENVWVGWFKGYPSHKHPVPPVLGPDCTKDFSFHFDAETKPGDTGTLLIMADQIAKNIGLQPK